MGDNVVLKEICKRMEANVKEMADLIEQVTQYRRLGLLKPQDIDTICDILTTGMEGIMSNVMTLPMVQSIPDKSSDAFTKAFENVPKHSTECPNHPSHRLNVPGRESTGKFQCSPLCETLNENPVKVGN